MGEFDTGHQLISIYKDGTYEIRDLEIGSKIDMDKWIETRRYVAFDVISAIHYDGGKGWTMVKRFEVETTRNNERYKFISDASGSKLYFATVAPNPVVQYSYKTGGKKREETLNLAEFIDVKGWKAMGNKLGEWKILSVKADPSTIEKLVNEPPSVQAKPQTKAAKEGEGLKPGDTIELDF